MVGTPNIPGNTQDRILAALSTNTSAYNSAAATALVEITSAMYSAILADLSGASLKGIDNYTGQGALGSINDMKYAE